jgi:aldehyde dehydrogenase (NAD+)
MQWGNQMDIKEIYQNMDYGTAPESAEEANAWLDKNNRIFSHFIDGEFVSGTDHFETINPATGKSLAHVSQASSADVNSAVAAANRAFKSGEHVQGLNAQKCSMRSHGTSKNMHAFSVFWRH